MHSPCTHAIQTDSDETWAIHSAVVEAALESPRLGSIVLDDRSRVVHLNSKLKNLLGVPAGAAVLHATAAHLLSLSAALDPASSECLLSVWKKAIGDAESSELGVCLTVEKGSRTFHFENRRIGARHWISTFEDITNNREQECRVSEAALSDSLTGLANRRRFEQALSEAFRKPEVSATVLFIDLDRFKAVNDTLGHAIGDEVLRLVSQRLQSVVRSCDVTARLGGDEFAILAMPALSDEEASNVATRIVDLLQRTYLVSGHVVNIGASVGIASAPRDGADRDTLLQSADLALYQSKAAGRGRFHFFDPAMQVRAQERRNLELDLRKAIALRQFEVHYLPRIELGTGKLLGLEALLRWRHPKKGLLLPEEFLPVAQEIGLMVPIGDWLIRTVCRQATRTAPELVMIVSAFRQQFENCQLAESVNRSLTSAAIHGSRLEIQITEDILLRNKAVVLETLHRLRELRVRIVMDDFGTGYASLSQLASFPFDRINIGRSLMAEDMNVGNRAIMRAVAALGASLGVTTSAAGVETPEQLARLHSEGCESVKGYLPTHAVAPGDLDKYLGEISAAGEPLASVA